MGWFLNSGTQRGLFFSSCIFNPYFQICFVDDDQRQGNFTFLKRTEDLLDAARSRLVYKRIAKQVDWQNTNVPNGPRKGGGLYNHTMYSIFNIHGIYVLIKFVISHMSVQFESA